MPPTDPRFLDATLEDILLDYHAHRLWENPKLEDEEVVADDFEADLAAMEAESMAREAELGAAPPAIGGVIETGPGPSVTDPPADPGDWEEVVSDRY